MASLGTLSVDIELNGDGEFITSINKVDKATSAVTKSIDKSVKSFSSLSSVFSRSSGTASTLSSKMNTLKTASGNVQKNVDQLATALEVAAAASASAAKGISDFTKAVNGALKGTKDLASDVKDLSKSLQNVGSAGQKAASGISGIGGAASKSASQMRGFATSADATYNSLKGWSKTTNAVTTSLTGLGESLSQITAEARALRTELNSIDRLRAPNTNSLRKSVSSARTQTDGNNSRSGSTVADVASAGNGRYASSIDNVTESIKKSSSAHTSFIHNLTETAFVIDEVTQAASVVWEVFGSWTEKVVEVNAHTEKLILTLKGLSSATTDAGRQAQALSEYNQIFSMAQGSPFAIDKLSEGLVRFKSANLSQPIATLQSVSDALAHFGANDQQFDSVTLAIQQMGGKGVVSLEELRRQMGEALPHAMQDMADAMNVSMGQLVKMVTAGSLESTRALQLMSDQFNRLYGGSSEQKMKTFSGQVSLLQSNMQKLALAVGGRGMDGSYGPNSSYGQLTKTIETLNKALESPQAQAAARALNDALSGIGRTLESLIDFSVSWGGTIVSMGTKIAEVVIAIKAMNMALKGTAAIMEAIQASKFLGSSGALGLLNGVGSKATTTYERNAVGETVGATTTRSAGYLQRATGFMGEVAEGGVASIAGAGVAKYATWMKSVNSGLLEMAGSAGTAETAMALLGTGFITIAAPLAAAAAAFALIYTWMNRVTSASAITGQSIQNALQGDTSSKTMNSARNELIQVSDRLNLARAKQSEIDSAGSGQDFRATSFGDTLGVTGVKSAGTALFGDGYLAAGSKEAVDYKKQLDSFVNMTSDEQKRLQTLIDNAPSLKDNQRASEVAKQYMDQYELSRRDTETEFATRQRDISDRRLKLNPNDVDGQAALNQEEQEAVLKTDTDSIGLMRDTIADAQKQLNNAFTSKDLDSIKVYSGAVTQLKKNLADMIVQLQASEERLGKPITLDSQTQAVKDQKAAETAIANLKTKYNEVKSAVDDGATSVSNFDKAQAKVADSHAPENLKKQWLDAATALDTVQSALQRVQAAQKAVSEINASAERSVQNVLSSSISLSGDQNEYTRDYSNTVAKNNMDANSAIRNLSINDSGLDDTQFTNVQTAINQTKASYDSLGESVKAAYEQLDQSKASTDSAANSVSVLSVNAGTAGNAMSVASVAFDKYTNSASSAYQSTSLLGQQLKIIGATNVANLAAGLDSALRNLSRLNASNDSMRDRLETPQQALARHNAERAASTKESVANIDAVLASPEYLQKQAQDSGDSVDKIKANLSDLRQRYLDADAAAQKLGSEDAMSKLARQGAPAQKAINSLKETLAGYQSELSGDGAVVGKFAQTMKDLGFSVTPANKALAEQVYQTKQLVDAQNRAISTANELIKSGEQKGSEADSIFGTLGEDPSRLTTKLSNMAGRYKSAIQSVMKNVNPNDGGKYSAAKQGMINDLQTGNLNAQKDLIAQQVNSYVQGDREIQTSFADTLAKKRDLLTSNLETDTKDVKKSLQDQLDAGNMTIPEFKTAMDAVAAYHADKMKEIEHQTENSLQTTGREWGDSEKLITDGLNSMMSDFVDTMATQLSTGTASWKSFGQSVLKIIDEIALKMALSPLMSALGNAMGGSSGGGGGILGSFTKMLGIGGGGSSDFDAAPGADFSPDMFHSGGIVGVENGDGPKSVASNIFNTARKYHTGGVAGGLAGDEIPAILRKGEGVFTAAQMQQIGGAYRRSAMMDSVFQNMASSIGAGTKMATAAPAIGTSMGGSGAGAPKLTMNFHNQTGSDMKATSGSPKFDGEAWVIDTVIKHATKPGALRNTLGGSGK